MNYPHEYNEFDEEYEGPMTPGPIMSLRDAMQNLMNEAIIDPMRSFAMSDFAQNMMGRVRDGFEDLGLEPNELNFPRTDIKETESKIIITAEIAGVDPDDIEVEVEEDFVFISGMTNYQSESGGEEETFHTFERHFGSFERVLPLPAMIDPESAVGEIEHGLLTLSMNKILAVPTKTVNIKIKTKEKNTKITKKTPAKKKSTTKKKAVTKRKK